jgi:GGDEF domain-containing protein
MNPPSRWSTTAIALGLVGAQGVLHWRTRRALALAHADLGQLRTENNRLHTENTRLRHRRDPVTGTLLRDAWLSAARASLPELAHPALVFCDVNGLKLVNDQHGHRAGDTLLRQVTDQLRAGFGLGALIGRFGGDEFVILVDLPGQWRSWLRAAVTGCVVGIDGIVSGAAFGFARPVDLARRDNATWRPLPAAVQLASTQLDRLLHAADLALLRAKTRCHDEGLPTAIEFYGPRDKAVPAHLDPDPRDRIRDDVADPADPTVIIPRQPSRYDRADD